MLEADLAGPAIRSLAYLMDLLIRGAALALLAMALAFADKAGTGIMLIVAFLMEWFYPVLFEVFRNGQTPGKKIFAITVMNDNLTPVSLGGSLTRNLLRAADFLPFMYFIGFFSSLINGQFKRLGDIAAGTIVVHREVNTKKAPTQKAVKKTEAVKPTAPPISLNFAEQQAILEFYDRRDTLSQARRVELAEILAPVLDQRETDNFEQELLNIGAWLAGQ